MASYKVTIYKNSNTEIRHDIIVKPEIKQTVINVFSNIDVISREEFFMLFPNNENICKECALNKDDCVCNELNNIYRRYDGKGLGRKPYKCYNCVKPLDNCICAVDEPFYCDYGCGIDLNKEQCICEELYEKENN